MNIFGGQLNCQKPSTCSIKTTQKYNHAITSIEVACPKIVPHTCSAYITMPNTCNNENNRAAVTMFPPPPPAAATTMSLSPSSPLSPKRQSRLLSPSQESTSCHQAGWRAHIRTAACVTKQQGKLEQTTMTVKRGVLWMDGGEEFAGDSHSLKHLWKII